MIIKLHLNWFTFYNINKVTRGNDFRPLKNISHYDLRKFSFTNRIVNIWNSLPCLVVVDVDSVDLFKSRLDNFWMFQDVKYDYTANLAGNGDRSENDIESYWKVVVFEESYGHRGSSEPTSVNIIDFTWLDLHKVGLFCRVHIVAQRANRYIVAFRIAIS